MNRLDREDYFMLMAHLVALRSTCNRARVGAVVVKDFRVVTTGYNGSPRGLPHCDDLGHWMVEGHCVRTIHAEQNAILQAAYHGLSVNGGLLYCTHRPCLTCSKLLINAGIRAVVWGNQWGDYPDQGSQEFLEAAALGFRLWQPSPLVLTMLPNKDLLWQPPSEES